MTRHTEIQRCHSEITLCRDDGAVHSGGAVVPLETPRGIAATTTHHGDYGGLGRANSAILAWCRAHDRALAGPSWEVYGHWHADPAELRTDVYYLLQEPSADTRA